MRSITAPESVLARAEERRITTCEELRGARRSELGQFFTPIPLASLMADMFNPITRDSLRILDPGAGSGSLTSALVHAISEWPSPPERLEASLIEVDHRLEPVLREALSDCELAYADHGIDFDAALHIDDFLRSAAPTLGSEPALTADLAIVNPPYRKIRVHSPERAWARACGVEVSNLYAAFVAATVASLAPGGQMVAITPRSFTNGTYFRRFRRYLLERTAITKLHVFDSRDQAFHGDGVLQENLIMHAVRGPSNGDHRVRVSASRRPGEEIRTRTVQRTAVVDPADPEAFIRLPVNATDAEVAARMAVLPARLEEFGLTVSTGPVVDFRVRAELREVIDDGGAVPLLYPAAIRNSGVRWPTADSRKPVAISSRGAVAKWLVPDGNYVLVRRLSAKEEPRRVVAGVLREGQLGFDWIGIENHLNYFHQAGAGIDQELALGLAAYLNSSFVDTYIRLFNGHTQVNASDLRALRYPSEPEIRQLASAAGSEEAAEALIARFSGNASRIQQ